MNLKSLFITLAAGSILFGGGTTDIVKAQNDLAKRLFSEGRYRESLTEYDALTRVIDTPEMYLASFGKANSYFYLGDYQSARDEYQRVYTNIYAPYEFKLRSAYNLVMAAHAQRDMNACDKWADNFLRYYGATPYAHYASFFKGNVYFEAERYTDAKPRFKEFLKLYPANDRTNEANWKLMVIDYLEKRDALLKLAEEIKLLQKQVEAKEKEVARREKEVEEKKKQLDEFEKQLNARSKQLDERSKQLDDRSKQLDTREKDLNTKEADLKAYEKKLADQRAELKKLEDMLNSKKSLLDEKEKALKEAERILAEREKKFTDAVSKALTAAPTTTTTTTSTTNVQKTTTTTITPAPVTNTPAKPATNAAKKTADDW